VRISNFLTTTLHAADSFTMHYLEDYRVAAVRH
jgi:hypothetical protein